MLSLDIAGQKLNAPVEKNGKEENPANPYWPYVISTMGRVTVDRADKYHLSLKPDSIKSEKKLGLTLVSVKLVPVKK